MPKYDRLLYILNLLRSRRNLNAGRLAEECGVTERSIYRDIVALSEANIPIYYDNGYKLASDSFLPPLNFDYDEYYCLKITLESSPLRKTGKYREVIRRLQAKLEANTPEPIRKRSRFTPHATHLSISSSMEEKRCENSYGVIEEAITNHQCLRLCYTSIESGMSERVVEPYFIIFRGKAFYFVAYCHFRQEFRTFRLDRVEAVEAMSERFVPRDDVSVETYFDGSWEIYSGEPVDVVVRLKGPAARVALSGVHHPDEQIEKVAVDEVLYRVETRGIEEIQRWILGFGGDAEVLEPPELREALAAIGSHYRELYGPKGHKRKP
jgi:predicted DNA-binding transcriptional regulator YafY